MPSRCLILLSALLITPASLVRADDAPLFPFVVSFDAPDNATNVSGWLPKPAGKGGFIREAGGHFVDDAGAVRIWGTNLCFSAPFGTHEQSTRVAARLARLGINCVRLHHMDSRNIWGRSPNKTIIDPEQLERLDFLIAQLKRNGVYVDINLHVSRWFDTAEGFTARTERPEYDKGLDNFEPRMIELQKKYARDLLTHVNRYTGNPYTNEPSVACVEINNENALFSSWAWGRIDDLPEPYATTFRKQWNAWLRQKYGDTPRLARVWNVGSRPLGKELTVNGDLSQGLADPWHIEKDDQCKLETAVRGDGPEGKPCLHLQVIHGGRVSWRPQLILGGQALEADMPYTLRLWARSDQPRKLAVNAMMNHDPWEHLGLSTNITLQPHWKEYRLTFTAKKSDGKTRLSFGSLAPGLYEIAGVSLRSGGTLGLEPGQRIEDDTVPYVRHGAGSVTKAVMADFVDFICDTEHAYWSGMHDYVKNELHCRALVMGTQLGYSPVHVQAGLDYIDNHAYWEHPHFPGKPWDGANWYLRDVALADAANGGTLTRLAAQRVAGRAYTVTEYNHPQPNSYAAEGFPMIAAYGAFQGWDGIYNFAYAHSDKFEERKINSYFNLEADTVKLVHYPACAAMFLRGDVAPARETLRAPLSTVAERTLLHETQDPHQERTDRLGLTIRQAKEHAVALDLTGTTAPAAAADTEGEKITLAQSDTGQIRWSTPGTHQGAFTVDAPRTKVVTGFVANQKLTLGNVALACGPTRPGWATISLVCLDGSGFDRPGRILIAATAAVQNRNWKLEHLTGDQITLRWHWGEEPVMCEGVPLAIRLSVPAARVRCYPLDEAGNRRAPAKVTGGEHATLQLGPEYQTVWYEAVIQ